MTRNQTRVCIAYPADPAGSVPGGIDTFIRGEINNAPDDIEYSVIGITTDENARPVGKWTNCSLKNGTFRFFPVISHKFTDRAPFVPVTVRYLLKAGKVIRDIDVDVIEVHRVEPLLLLRTDTRPKTAVLHQNMRSLYDENADIRWSALPRLYFWLEDRVVPQLDSAFCVRDDAAEYYRSRFANIANSCYFQPTWADPQQFAPVAEDERETCRKKISVETGWDDNSLWLVSVGRLDTQKDPLLLIESFKKLVDAGRTDIRLMLVGEGPLREPLVAAVQDSGLDGYVKLLGLKGIDEVTEILHAADLFVMSSSYEGMPMAVIEALACGIPVATTRVGEVARVVDDGVCGRISASRSADDLCAAIQWCIDNLSEVSGEPCIRSASKFSPSNVLTPVYENYRRLAAGA